MTATATIAWRIPRSRIATDPQLSADSDWQDLLPGTPLRAFVSTPAATWSVSAYRIGDYGGKGAGLALAFDVPLVQQAERAGVPVAYTTVSALSTDPWWLSGAAGAIFNGHDEYWTLGYRKALTDARDGGSNLAFLGANAGYRRIRLADRRCLVVGYKDAGLDPRSGARGTTARWRDAPPARGENSLIRQMYDCFPSRGAMRIRQPGCFLFDGTGVRRGQAIEGLVGIESDRVHPITSTPRPLQIPALSGVACRGIQTWSTVAYYSTSSGSGLLATGTMNWSMALRGPSRPYGITPQGVSFVRRPTDNLLRQMAAGPMADRHAAADDLDEVLLPERNTPGSA